MTDQVSPSPDAFEDMRMLLAVMSDPQLYKRRLAELSDKTAAHNAAAELARQERAAADTKLAELNARQAALDERQRELDARAEFYSGELYQGHRDPEQHRRAAVREAREGILRPPHLSRLSRDGFPVGTTLTREFVEADERAPDPHYGI
jgi:hypothetical protein